MTYPIERDAPMPVTRSTFPFAELKVGESFFVPCTDYTSKAVHNARFRFTKTHPGWSFTCAKVQHEGKTGTRVKRLEDKL